MVCGIWGQINGKVLRKTVGRGAGGSPKKEKNYPGIIKKISN